MKASDAKQFIGKFVRYKKSGGYFRETWRYGTVESTQGRNIILKTDALWAPDILVMELAPEDEEP